MNELVEHPDDGEVEKISVGDGSDSVSLKIYQDVYNQITGRTEQIRQRSFANLLLEFSDIEQLHTKIMQLCDVHRVVAENEAITVFHDKERKESFSSFARFRAYNSNTTRPTVSILLKYNFSIVVPGTQRAQEYIVSVRLSSRVASTISLDEDVPPRMRIRFMGMGFLSEPSAVISIDYVDYVIARGFVEAYEEWVAGCQTAPDNLLIQKAQMYSHWLPLAIKIIIAALITFCAFKFTGSEIMTDFGEKQWARFTVIYLGGAYILLAIASRVGNILESLIDSVGALSYIKINKGDEKVIAEYEKRNSQISRKFVFNLVITVVLGIVSAKLEKLI